MNSLLSVGAPALAALLLSSTAQAPPAGAQSDASRPRKSVYGTLESVDASLNGVIMKTNTGERMAWRFSAPVVAEVGRFKPGDPMIVIYRQLDASNKRVTAIAFPGATATPIYVNMTGSRVLLRSAPDKDGVCGAADASAATDSIIPVGGMGEATGACWCCANPDQSCTPGSKTGLGKALLVNCFE